MNYRPEALEAAQSLMGTLLRIKNEGLELRMEDYVSKMGGDLCGTVCCVAGWHAAFSNPEVATWQYIVDAGSKLHIQMSEIISHKIADYDGFEENSSLPDKVGEILFGTHRGDDRTTNQTLVRQIRAARWFINRQEKLRDYEALRAMPRKERRKLGLAA